MQQAFIIVYHHNFVTKEFCKMKKILYFFTVMMLLIASCKQLNLAGKTRNEILVIIEKYPKYKIKNTQKIVLDFNSGSHYYNSIEEIKKDKVAMNSKKWDILKERTFLGWKYIRLTFSKDKVISQENKSRNDGP